MSEVKSIEIPYWKQSCKNPVAVFSNEGEDKKNFSVVNFPPPTPYKTSRYMSVYDVARVIGFRAKQIESGSTPLVKLGDMTRSQEIAEAEFRSGLLPLNVVRIDLEGNPEERDIRHLEFVE